ncbi:MAG TPA: hypothetical protein VNH11_11735 [Pirellulales bacterium]|nr:hypothetical protein [Pirellulales bacterium]
MPHDLAEFRDGGPAVARLQSSRRVLVEAVEQLVGFRSYRLEVGRDYDAVEEICILR